MKLKLQDVFDALATQLDCTKALNSHSHSGHGDIVDLRNEWAQVLKP